MKELGAKDIPSLPTLRCVQEKLGARCGIRTKQYKSAQGNVFYVNDIPSQIAKVHEIPMVILRLTLN